MKINKIRIKNFKSIGGKWEEFEFPLSLNLINGDVGCGKTTVYSAITYVLYNKNTDFKGNSKSTLPVNKLINDNNKKELLVEIELDNGYTIKRGQKPDVFEILKDGENLANKSVTVDQSFLENTILGGMTFDIFLSTVYLSNKPGSTPFIHMTQTQRKEYIEKILDLRRLHYYNENLKKYIAENKLEKASLDKELLVLDETITNEEFNINIQLKKQAEDKQRLKDFEDNYETRLQEQTDAITLEENYLKKLEDKLQNFKIQDIQDEVQEFDKEIKDLETSLEQIKAENLSAQELQNIQDIIDKNTKILKDLDFEINMLEGDLKFLDKDIQDEQEILYNVLIKDIEEITVKINKLNEVKIQKDANYQAYKQSKENYHHCGDCSKLSYIIGSFNEQEHLDFVSKASEIITNLKQELNDKIKTKEQIERIRKQNQEIKDNIQDKKNTLDKLIRNKEYLKTENINTERQIQDKKDNYEKERKLKIQNIEDKIKNTQIKKDNYFNEKKQEIQVQIDKVKTHIKYIQDKIEMIKKEDKPIVREVNTEYLLKLKEKKIAIKEAIDLEYNKSVELDALKKEINSPEHKVKAIRKYIPVFENKLNEILEIFMEDDVFDLKAKLSEEFDLTFYKNGKEIPVFTLSSGQVACCSLACTFAFLYLLEVKHHNNFEHLLIDELLDINIGTRIHKVLMYLKTIATNKNISVISHNKTLDVSLFDTITYVTKDDMFSKYVIS